MPNDKEITIYDLAELLNVSTATISRALQDDPVVSKKTKKRVSDLAEKMGYRSNHFARNLRNKTTNTIGVIVPRLNSYFISTVIAGIEQMANCSGYNLIITQSSESSNKEMDCVRTMFNSRVDGLLASLAYDTADSSYFDTLLNKNIPVVFFDRVASYKQCTNVLIDNRKSSYEATAHLIGQGCKRIVHISAASQRNVYVDRLQGYKQALADHHIKFKKEYVILNNLSQEAGETAAAQILGMSVLPDGIFAANDNCAVGCIIALKKAGIRIPDDIAVVGFNNDPVSTVIEPNLTTVNYPGYEMGKVAAQHLIVQLKETVSISAGTTVLLNSDLIVRASSLKIKV